MTRNATVRLCALLVLALACAAPPIADVEPHAPRGIADVPGRAWSELAKQRIYFGHQSVGENILEGVRELTHRNPQIDLRVREIVTTVGLDPGVLAHEKVGRNLDYRSKLEAFAGRLDGGLAEQLDVALLKFCYVDVGPSTDVSRMFREYEETLRGLRARHPSITFVHVTEPLTWRLTGAPAILRRGKDVVHALFGRRGYGRFFDNAPRNRFNELLSARYAQREPIFDLAAVEATRPDGRRLAYDVDGRIDYAMVPAYTDDGGHLNALGRAHVAEQFLVFLADLVLASEESGAGDGL